MDKPPHTGPLAGMRVLELAQIMAGPTCGMMLADMGADVIKVEKLPGGDDARAYREPRVNGVSAPFMILNRNKRGIALNLKHAQGRDILLRMVKDADVLIENFRRGTLEKLGPRLRGLVARSIPGLIYCAMSGYGRDGPYADKPRLRPDRPGLFRPDVDHRRAGRPAGQDRQLDRRHQRRHPGGGRHHRGLCPQAEDRRGPDRRHLADRSGPAADLLAGRDLFRHRRIVRPDRLRAPADRALPGLPGQRRLDQHRRRQPGQLGAHRRGARATRSGARTRASPPIRRAWSTARRWWR